MKIMMFVTCLITCGMLTACGTVEGMGKDLQSLGKTIEKTAGNDSKSATSPAPSSDAVVTPIK